VNVSVIIGTRPEAIKLAPVIRELNSRPGVIVNVVATAQHRELLDQALEIFSIRPAVDLSAMQTAQNLAALTARMLVTLEGEFTANRPDVVVVQGDTTTVLTASLAAFYARVPVAHVEAGLRSGDLDQPFPEEMNRRVATILARWHFAPTARARENLLAEGIAASRVVVTGNTVVDALHSIVESDRFQRVMLPFVLDPARRLVLVTLHRRESWGEPLAGMCRALRDLCAKYSDLQVVFPVHLNPAVRATVEEVLGDVERVQLLRPLEYVAFLKVMQASFFVMTDSGGVQEEAPVFGRPVLVLRDRTERPEAIAAGVARRVGTTREAIVAEASRLLDDAEAYLAMARASSPFGDGRAAARIADVLTERLR
jgi:UDP-N-acetylglucosamine 2-epimerase (non-hydrolysing)